MRTVYTDRSRVEQFQRCKRLRYLEYHAESTGITSANKPLPLALGGAVHVGLQFLLLGKDEDTAVAEALRDLSRYSGSLALDDAEAAAQASTVQVPDDIMRQQLAESLGMSVADAGLDSLMTTQASGKKAFDDYLWNEQSGLVEGLVRAYARRRLRPLLGEFEVLEVEREGTWELAAWKHSKWKEDRTDNWEPWSLVFMSRPDALLRSRADNSLYLLSFKTAATWDRRKELDAQHDMQGLSEGVEVEKRLGEWWSAMHGDCEIEVDAKRDLNDSALRTWEYLRDLPAPPRILGIRYEYLYKSYRGEDKDLSQRFGFTVWSQRSHLVRRYRAVSLPKKGEGGFNLGDFCWSYDYLREDGTESKLYYGHWKSEPVDNVKAWIDQLDQSEETMSAFDSTVGLEPRPLGWKSAGQAMGFTNQHPLDAVFHPPITVFRQDDDLRDFIEEIEEQEVKVAEAVAQVEAAQDEDERRSLLNKLFPRTRRACVYPSTCQFCQKGQDVCFGGEEIRRDPLGSGKFVRRVPNHPVEGEVGAEQLQK